jgi:hypothetical protein
MRKLIIFLMVLSLIFMSVAPNVFAAFTEANVGPTTDFDGDINIPSGKSYYINSTLLALTDITTAGLISEAMLDGVAAPADEDILTYEADTTNFEWHTIAELGLQTAITGTDTHVMFFDGANTPAGEAGLTYNKTTDALTAVTFIGALTGNADTCTTASAGDAAVDFFGAGVDAVTDATTCTDIEGDLLSITTSVLNVTIPADHITADMITTVNCGINCTWDATNDEVDIDDVFHLFAGDIATGVHDFGGATSFELPNSATPTLTATGTLALDTTVADITNGCLAYYDGTTINYVVSLAVADIWSSDDYVVAYDAAADKFYMKVDATAGSANWTLHLMDVDAADADYVHAAITGTGASQDVSTAITNPDFGRNITITTTNVAAPSGNVTITGTLADGTTGQTDAITISAGALASGVKAFVTVTNINTPAGLSASDTVEVGIGDLIGLPNSINAEADIYMKTVDGVEEFSEISGNGNTTYNTLNCATIIQNEDITLYYHN